MVKKAMVTTSTTTHTIDYSPSYISSNPIQAYQKGNNSKKLTPLMEQYWSIKNQHLDKILLFQMGDFYEMFYEDARKAAPLLNIALTSRNRSHKDQVPMCGVPCTSVGACVSKLLAEGQKVAICSQVEGNLSSPGLMKREVVQILTPGMVYDPETLDAKKANYLCSFDFSLH